MAHKVCNELLQNKINSFVKLMKKINPKITKKELQPKIEEIKNHKRTMDDCILSYYNDSNCKGTIFEPGKNHDKIIENILGKKDIKKGTPLYKLTRSLLLPMRKDIFGKKDNVLVDNFYEGLSKSDVAQLKSKGATSGCTKINPFDSKAVQKTKSNLVNKMSKVLTSFMKSKTMSKRTTKRNSKRTTKRNSKM
jgi:hypothetical protein